MYLCYKFEEVVDDIFVTEYKHLGIMEGFNIRLIACSSLQFVFSVLLNACMYQSFKKAKKPTDWYIGFGVWTGLSSIIQFIVIVFSYKR